MLEQSAPEVLHPMLGQSVKRCSLWEGAVLQELWNTVSCRRDLTLEHEKSVMSCPPAKEEAAEFCDEPALSPVPHLPALLGDGR